MLTVCLLLLQVSRAQTPPVPLSKEPPLWSATPKQIGYSLSDFKNFRATVGGDRVKIQFLDGQRLALAWLTSDEVIEKTTGAFANVPSHLHIAILDSQSGQSIAHHEWACSSLGVNIAYTATGEWLLSSDNSVTLYSRSFDKLRDLQNVRPQRFHTFVSPSGRTFWYSQATQMADGLHNSEIPPPLRFWILWKDALVAKAHFAYSDRYILGPNYSTTRSSAFVPARTEGSWTSLRLATEIPSLQEVVPTDS